MKKVCFWLVLMSVLLSSCTSSKWFLVDSYGILSYDRISGKWELMWEFKTKQPEMIADTVHVRDSVVTDAIKSVR